jgi:cellobiose transport system permease protein
MGSAGPAIGFGSRLTRIAVRAALPLGVPISLFPCYWLAVMASGTTQDIYSYPPKLVPGPHSWTTWGGCSTPSTSSAPSGTRSPWPWPWPWSGPRWCCSSTRRPRSPSPSTSSQLSLVPQFVTMAEFGWAGSLKALILPGAANAFGVFTFIGLWNDYIWPLVVMINIGARHFLRDLAAGVTKM